MKAVSQQPLVRTLRAVLGIAALLGGVAAVSSPRAGAQVNPLDQSAPAGPPFAGRFSDGTLTLELRATGMESYEGTITRGPQSFRATAAVRNGGALEGSFEAGGRQSFPFTASLAGDTLNFATGSARYALQRQQPDNPLATGRPASPATPVPPPPRPQQQQQQPPQRTAAPAGAMRFETYVVKDDPSYIGGEIARVLIPAGWKVDGGVVWDLANTYFPAQMHTVVYNPKGLEGFAFFPNLYYYWSYDAWSQQLMPPGTNYSGSIVRQPVRDVFAAITELVLPTYRKQLLQARVVEREELPKLAELSLRDLQATPMPGAQFASFAGRIRFEYEVDGQTVQEDVYAVLNATAATQLRFVLWNVSQLISIRGPKGTLKELATLEDIVQRSTMPNIEWYNKYVQFVQARHNVAMDAIHQAGVRSQIIANMNNEISNTIRESYENTQRTNDRISEARSNVMRGVTNYNAGSGYTVQLPSQYNHAWQSSDGQYIVTNDPNYNPNSDLNNHGTWSQMQPTR